MKILITGGAGRIGSKLRREWAGQFTLIRTFDLAAAVPAGPDEESVIGSVADLAALTAALEGIDGIVHLAGVPHEGPFESILTANVVGTWNVYEAARLRGVRRVVFGSSNHVTGFYPRAARLGAHVPMRPDTRYGLSKCWGEMVASLYADKHDIKSLIVRIGNAVRPPDHIRALSVWISDRDLAQLCRIGLAHPDIDCQIVYGVSDNAASWYDNSAAAKLGYRPQDRAEDYRAQALAGEAQQTHHPVADVFQGGMFCAIDYDGPLPPQASLRTD